MEKIPKSPGSTFRKIIEKSKRQMQAKLISEQYHLQKLDKLLAKQRMQAHSCVSGWRLSYQGNY